MNALLPSKLARLVSHWAQTDVGALIGVLRLFFGHQIAQGVDARRRWTIRWRNPAASAQSVEGRRWFLPSFPMRG